MSVGIGAISGKTDRIATGIAKISGQIDQSVSIVLNDPSATNAPNAHIACTNSTPRTPVDTGAAVERDGSPSVMSTIPRAGRAERG